MGPKLSVSLTPAGESDSSESAFCWTFPGCPISIYIPFVVIARLQVDLDLNEHLATISGAEVGGVLLGHKKTPSRLEIEAYVWLPSQAQRVGQYQVNHAEFARTCSESKTVVGYFRTVSGDDFRLREPETAFIKDYLPDPSNVALLIQTSNFPYTAGFFFWMKDGGMAPLSFMDFPLNAEILRNQTKFKTDGSSVAKASPKPDTVNDHDGAEFHLAGKDTQGESIDTTSAEDALAILDSSRDFHEKSAPTTVPNVHPGPRPGSGSTFGKQLTLSAPDRASTLSETQRAPEMLAVSKNSSGHTSRRTLVIGIMVIALLPLITLGSLLLRRHGPSIDPPVVAAGNPLELEVEAASKGLDIRWNPLGALVAQAREGRLLIAEGGAHQRTIALNHEELTSGHIYYHSLTKHLRFQLEITDQSGKVSKESVVALSPVQ
jgi:hypothetical protein